MLCAVISSNQPTKQLHMCVVEMEEIATCTYHKPYTSSGQIVLLRYFHQIIPFFCMNHDKTRNLLNDLSQEDANLYMRLENCLVNSWKNSKLEEKLKVLAKPKRNMPDKERTNG